VISAELLTDDSFANRIIVQGGWSVPDAAHLIIKEFACSAIRTGELHIYRGVLNDQGKAYLKLFKVCAGNLMTTHRLTEQEAVEELRELYDEIAAIG